MTRPHTRSQSRSSTSASNSTKQPPKKAIAKTRTSGLKPNESTEPMSYPVLVVGDKLPDHNVVTDDGEEVSILELSKQSAMILFMYPKANTPGCTKQACGFRDEFIKFTSLGYSVYGLSADSPTAQRNWKTKYELPYRLLSDRNRTLIKSFGASKPPNSTRRSVVIVDKGGIIKAIELDISPLQSIERALAFVNAE